MGDLKYKTVTIYTLRSDFLKATQAQTSNESHYLAQMSPSDAVIKVWQGYSCINCEKSMQAHAAGNVPGCTFNINFNGTKILLNSMCNICTTEQDCVNKSKIAVYVCFAFYSRDRR